MPFCIPSQNYLFMTTKVVFAIELPLCDVSKLIGEKWKTLTDEDKKVCAKILL